MLSGAVVGALAVETHTSHWGEPEMCRGEVRRTRLETFQTAQMNNAIGTRGGIKGPSQFPVGGDIFDLPDYIYQSPHHWRDSPVTQNPAGREA